MPELNVLGVLTSQTCSHNGDSCTLVSTFTKSQTVEECGAARTARREALQKQKDELVALDITGKIAEIQAQIDALS